MASSVILIAWKCVGEERNRAYFVVSKVVKCDGGDCRRVKLIFGNSYNVSVSVYAG
jgi:hypothetical protein